MINNVVLMGRLTAEPELKTTGSGVSVLSFTVAVDRSYQKAGTERQADFINCVAWRQTAEFIGRYFRKGQMIALTGSIQTRSYDDRDGKKRYVTEVVVDNASFCGSKSETGANQNAGYAAPAAPAFEAPQAQSFSTAGADDFSSFEQDDELPF
ncbi:MAG: single-stranded DNA-binding protein [Clostridia bacterium]|nr:single-stranded DNA-binding protein [Clostridia bacterium]